MRYENELLYPTNRHDDSICFVGIDPGTVRLGFASIIVDPRTLGIKSIRAYTVRVELLADDESEEALYIGRRTNKLRALSRQIYRELDRLSPVCVAHETAYFNPKRPNAFESLTEAIAAIKVAVRDYSDRTLIVPIEPSLIKKKVGANPIGTKTPVKDAILRNAEITTGWRSSNSFPISDLDDHSHDAIAIAFTSLLTYKEKITKELRYL